MHSQNTNFLPANPTQPKFNNPVLVHPNQRGNPLLQHIRQVGWSWQDSDVDNVEENFPDYLVGRGTAILFLSLKYHKLYPDYIYTRLQKAQGYRVLVLLCQVDIPDYHELSKELHALSFTTNITLFLSFSSEDAAKYIESFKIVEHRSTESIQTKSSASEISNPLLAQWTDALTKVKSVNKTDVVTLASNFKTFSRLVNAPTQHLSLCPGLGDKKVVQLDKAFKKSFITEEK